MRPTPLLLALVLCVVSSGCSMGGRTFTMGFKDADVTDKLLRVTEKPVSLGHKRLDHHSASHPGLAEFLEAEGFPDYIIEGGGVSDSQVAMFYLKKNRAWLCELRSGWAGLGGRSMKMNGPEPIGKKTKALLEALVQVEKAAANLDADKKEH